MSELTYVNYLKDLNTRVVQNGSDLGLDFEIGSSQLRTQLNVLEKYLLLNNLKLQTDIKGIDNLAGFDELTEDVWRVRKQKQLVQQQKAMKTKKLLFAKGNRISIVLEPFDTREINDYVGPEPEPEPEIEPDVTTSDFDIDEETETEESPNDNVFDDNSSLGDSLPLTEEEETPLDDEGNEEENDYQEPEQNEEEEDEDDSGPLLTDIFSDLQRAQNLFDEEDDEDEFVDEYAFVEEPSEHYPEEKYEGNEEEPPFETSLDFGPVTQPTMQDDLFGDNVGTEEFTFETPTNKGITGEMFEGNNTGQDQNQRDHVFTDTMVDKTTDALNKGLNAILKKLAK